MPKRLKKPCRHPGCPSLTRTRFCEQHTKDQHQRPSERWRGTAAERGYDSDWIKVAKARRVLDCFLCQLCEQNGKLTEARIVDHIIPIHVRPDWRLELANTQVLCESCHQHKTNQDNARYGSSTSSRLTPQQLANRAHAQRPVNAPRTHASETRS